MSIQGGQQVGDTLLASRLGPRLTDVFALLADSERNISPNQTPAPSYVAPLTIIDGIVSFTFEVTTFAYSATVTHHYDGIVFSTGTVFQNLKDIKLYPDTGNIEEIIEGPAPVAPAPGGGGLLPLIGF
ncbi:hypothetical protein EZS27_015959 [termite gut metagenome]|uniref:Uncharacterized protein n=1 Tax=termite gut metagenome TaxID=433724 RepID=A0A5J4RQB0_9ZZZZ